METERPALPPTPHPGSHIYSYPLPPPSILPSVSPATFPAPLGGWRMGPRVGILRFRRDALRGASRTRFVLNGVLAEEPLPRDVGRCGFRKGGS